MLYREINAVCAQIHKKHTNTLCGQNVEFVNVKPGSTQSNQWTLNSQLHCLQRLPAASTVSMGASTN